MAEDDGAYLSHLIGLRQATRALDIDHCFDARLDEDVVASTNPFDESQIHQESPQIIEPDVGVRPTSQDSQEQIVVNGHVNSLATSFDVMTK